MDAVARHKSLIEPLRAAMADFEENAVHSALTKILAPDANVNFCFPFGTLQGSQAYYRATYAPLLNAWPDLERRDQIVIGGQDEHGHDWIGCCGFYCGTFSKPWLDIPPTGHLTHMRFHEFYRFKDGKVSEIQSIWDIPEVMMQANSWPLSPSLGREWSVPAPMTQDGLNLQPYNRAQSQASCNHVVNMLTALTRHPKEPPEAMELPKFWHHKMNWYGPAGIGTARGIDGFRNWHQIPFLSAMPDRGQSDKDVTFHFFGDGNYVGVTGWPNMIQTLQHGGWLGLPPLNKQVELRSLDFWRIENGKIRENWVLVDLLDMYHQIGIDVFGRMREFNKARCPA